MKGSDGSESPSFTFTPPPAEPSDVDLPAADGSVEVSELTESSSARVVQ